MNKEKKLKLVSLRVDGLGDKLGLPIDKGIRDTVVFLNALGFNTTSSCEGHLQGKHGYAAPWVDISPKQLSEVRRFKSDKELYRAQRKLNVFKGKSFALLNEFYRQRKVPYDRMLIVDKPFAFILRLQSNGLELLPPKNNPECKRKALSYKKEMQDFTKFLEKQFWKK